MEAKMVEDDRHHIIYVEDDADMVELVKLILERKGYHVDGAKNGRDGLEIIKRELPDLVLLDLMMPDIDGWNVFQQLRGNEDTKDIPVIVITAKAQSIDRVFGLHIAKANDYIAKPFKPQELVDSVAKVLGASAA
jgi:DNA-binding response OmpR family regulator